MDDLEDIWRQAGSGEDGEDVFGAGGGLGGGLQEKGVTGEKGRDE